MNYPCANCSDDEMCQWCREAHETGIIIGEQRATAKIVAWLREEAAVDLQGHGGQADIELRSAADSIEQGDHIENHAGGREGDNG